MGTSLPLTQSCYSRPYLLRTESESEDYTRECSDLSDEPITSILSLPITVYPLLMSWLLLRLAARPPGISGAPGIKRQPLLIF